MRVFVGTMLQLLSIIVVLLFGIFITSNIVEPQTMRAVVPAILNPIWLPTAWVAGIVSEVVAMLFGLRIWGASPLVVGGKKTLPLLFARGIMSSTLIYGMAGLINTIDLVALNGKHAFAATLLTVGIVAIMIMATLHNLQAVKEAARIEGDESDIAKLL